MSFTLINELLDIKQKEVEIAVEPILESVENLLQVLTAKVKNKPDAFLEHININELAAQLGALVFLGKAENRVKIEEFSKLDDKKLSENLFKFLRDIAEPHPDKIFDEHLTADQFLIYIGNIDAADQTKEWKTILTSAKNGDQASIQRVANAISKLNEFYAAAYRKLSAAYLEHTAVPASAVNTPSSLDSAIDALSA